MKKFLNSINRRVRRLLTRLIGVPELLRHPMAIYLSFNAMRFARVLIYLETAALLAIIGAQWLIPFVVLVFLIDRLIAQEVNKHLLVAVEDSLTPAKIIPIFDLTMS